MGNSTLKKAAIYTLGAFSGAILAIGIQGLAAEKDNKKQEAIPVKSLQTMVEVYSQIKANYYEDKPDEELLESAMKGMVAGLDPHSEYMNKKDYSDLKESTSGEFGGLGMEIGAEDGFVKVVAPIEDTPAERAGIKSGDFIAKINGVSTRGMSVSEAVKKMRGKPGTGIELTIARKDSPKPLTFKLIRAIIKVKSVRFKLLEPGYGYIRISQFQERTVESLNEAVKKLTKENGGDLKGLVLDLRDDPGGLLNGAVGISAAFLQPDTKIVSTKGRDGKEGMSLHAKPSDYILSGHNDPLNNLPASVKEIPLTVLINSGSASASEIVAGALQDHKRAVIVGTQSFGKGSVQTVLPLSNGSAVKLTTSLYYTPNDRSIQAQGIVPDVEIKDKNRTYESREADLARHIDNPLGGEEVLGGITGEDETDKADDKKKSDSKEKGKNNQPDAKDKDKNQDEDAILARREPNPEKDEQLKTALDLVKDPAKWKASLGLAATKAAKDKTKKTKDKKDKDEE